MKRIHSGDLARVALAKGAVVTHDGRAVNASRHRVNVAARQEPKPPEPAPAQPTPAPAPDRMADIVAQLVRQMAEQRQQPAPSADPIMAWEFQVTYDDSHPVQRIKSMRATAIRGKAA